VTTSAFHLLLTLLLTLGIFTPEGKKIIIGLIIHHFLKLIIIILIIIEPGHGHPPQY